MFIRFCYCIILVGCLPLFSCQQEEEKRESGIRIGLTDGELEMMTKSTPSELGKPLASRFRLQIKNADTGSSVYNSLYTAEVLTVSSGRYDITAEYLTSEEELAFDAPAYKGAQTGITLNEGETKDVSVACSVSNALASVTYANPEVFEQFYQRYGLYVTVGRTTLEWWSSMARRNPYFPAGSSVQFVFMGEKKDGSVYSYPIEKEEFKTIRAGYNYKLTLTCATATGGQFDIQTDTEVEKITVSSTVPEEWLPKPKVETAGFMGQNLTLAETSEQEAKIKFQVSAPLQELKFSFNFEDPRFTALNGEYLLSELPADKRSEIEAAGIRLPEIGATAPVVDLTALTSRLQMAAEGATRFNTMQAEAKANGRWSDEGGESATYTLAVTKPDFSVSVLPGNSWTKEFTMEEFVVAEGKGNPEKMREYIRYQYSADGGATWQDCESRTQKFATLPENKDYQVRAVYKDVPSEATLFRLEEPQQVPNPGMEEWYYTSLVKSKSLIYFPYQSEGASFWNTNNEFSTRYRDNALSSPYNCFPAVSYTKDAHSGTYAAELRNSAAGRGNTWFIGHTELEMNRVPGELFIGDITVTTNGSAASPTNDYYTIAKGKDFSSRPTALHFWYKYAPLSGDTWKAYIALYDENGELIIESTATSSQAESGFAEYTIPLNYEEGRFYKPCKSIYINFKSTVTSGKALPYETKTVKLWVDDSQKDYKNTFAGSVLTIDDITLIYDK